MPHEGKALVDHDLHAIRMAIQLGMPQPAQVARRLGLQIGSLRHPLSLCPIEWDIISLSKTTTENDIAQGLTAPQAPQVVGNHPITTLEQLLRPRRGVGRAMDIRQLPKRILRGWSLRIVG